MNIPDLDTKTIALVASIVSYVLYNVLFLAAQLWPAFATLFLGLYYLSICYGYAKKNRTVMIVGTVLQALVALIISGLFIFFVVEIFTPHVVYKILVYIKNMAESQGLAAARNCSIAMAIDSLITAAIHFWTLYFCIQECRVESNEKQEKPEKPEKQEKPTETYRFAEQSWTMLTNALNRLRFQRGQGEAHPSDSPIAAIAIHTELDYPQQLEIPRLRTTSQGEIMGVDSDRVRLSERHRSMPPPSRQHRSGSTQLM